VSALVAVDSLGPPDTPPETAPDRFAYWIADLARTEARGPYAPAPADAAARLRERFPRFSAEVAERMAAHGTRLHGDERVWKFDPLHQTSVPQPYYAAQARAFWRRITCPVLYLEGGESELRLEPDDLAARLAILRARRVAIEGTGHHPHLERPEAFGQVLLDFLSDGSN
jgi:pimeloyl-ACP methyl ester carboxylesterase